MALKTPYATTAPLQNYKYTQFAAFKFGRRVYFALRFTSSGAYVGVGMIGISMVDPCYRI